MTKTLNPVCLSSSLHRPVKDMIKDIKSGSNLSFASGKLRELSKMLPDEGEVLVAAASIFQCFLTTALLVISSKDESGLNISQFLFGSFNECRRNSWMVLRVILVLFPKQICLCSCLSRFPGELPECNYMYCKYYGGSWLIMETLYLLFSYVERISCLVLKEEFFPLMNEMKEFISTLTAAGQGNISQRGIITDFEQKI